jgi:hypothetical protein
MPTVSGIVVATGTEASGRRTLLDIVDELSRPVDASDTTVRALAADAFRAAVRTMNRKGMWPWEIQDEDITITANERFSSVASAIKKPLAMHYLTAAGGTPDQPIRYTPYDRFVEKYTLDVAGEAHTYTVPNLFETGQIRWFPVPSANDNARLNFYRVTPAPRAENEPVEIPDYAIEVYMSRAWYELSKRLPQGQRTMPIDMALGEARLAFREMSAHVNSPGDRSREVMARG